MKQLLIFAVMFLSAVASAQKPQEINLWPEGPRTNNGDPEDQAKVWVYLPDANKATGRAVVCCPGGGYQHLAMQHEGHDWAPFFTGQGIALIVVKYRMPHGHYTVPQEDADQAMRLVRSHAKEWNINPNDVGIMGFSAGGHLASTVATHSKGDAAPNFQILFYPVVSMEQGTTHKGSRNNLLGEKPKRKLVNEYCNEQSSWLKTTAQCPLSTASTITKHCATRRCLPLCTFILQEVTASASVSRLPTILSSCSSFALGCKASKFPRSKWL